jgi:CubicO group peptidase (beta-lactamase class C family)
MYSTRLGLLSVLLLGIITCAFPRAAASQATQTKTPDTPVGRQLAALLQALNTPDAKTIRAFVEKHIAKSFLEAIPLDEHVAVNSEVAQENGGLALERIEQANTYEIAALARAKGDDALIRIHMKVEEEPPHGISGLYYEIDPDISATPEKPGEGKLSEADILGHLETYLNERAEADRFSGAVLVAKGGEPIFARAYGLASKAFNVPNRVDTKFNLGSMNKMFTAIAVAQLAEKGKLSFDDTVAKHLPDYPNKEVANKVTIHHLLTHTSGMGDFFTKEYEKSAKERLRAVKDYFPLFVNEPLKFEPGQKWDYSNSGFMLLGAIIEKVSGQSYFDYVRENLYKPAGMTNTDCYEMDQDTPNLAIGYTRERASRPWKNNLYLHVVKGGPAGGGFSTVEDLLKFDIALRNHKLLNPKYTDRVLTGKVALPGSSTLKYAYGFRDDSRNGHRIVGHEGGFPGINSQLDIYLDLGYTVAVMSNYDPPAAARVANRMRDMFTQE